ncbi:MAG: glycine zipper 2TM domain-containing protein [Planctomycetota bacterium]
MSVEGDVGGEAAKNQIGDFFVGELLKKGYAPVERAQVQSILEEQKFQSSDITTQEGAARAGRILNVPAILVVSVPKFKEEMSLTAKIVDVEDGSILWLGSGSGSTGKILSTIVGATVGAVVGGVIAGGDSSDQVAGAVAGGVLGGVAGQALSPQKAEKVHEIVKKMCTTLPYRMPAR